MPLFPIPSTAIPCRQMQIEVWCGNEITCITHNCNLAVMFSFQLTAVLAFPDCMVFSIIHVLLKDCWKQVLKNFSFVTRCS